MSSSSTCCQEHLSLSPAASNASSGADSPLGSPTYTPNAVAPNEDQGLDVAGMLRKINDMLANSPQKEADNMYNTNATDSRGEVIPSGPRRPGQGCEEAHQAIMLAETSPHSCSVALRITLLAAGFIIGPIGGCVREISRLSGAAIRSRTVPADHLCPRDCREFVIEGPSDASVAHAMSIMVDAVNRYKTLCEGKCAGQVVSRSQHVAGVEFYYQPPPRSVVPFAACLKGHSKRSAVTSCTKEFVRELPSRTNGTPPLPPPRPPTFKAAVVGANSNRSNSESTEPQRSNNGIVMMPISSARSSPLKRSATSPPPPPPGFNVVASGASSSAAEMLSFHPPRMASKLTRLNTADGSAFSLFEDSSFNQGAAPAASSSADVLAAAAAAVGLPFISLGRSDGGFSSSTMAGNNGAQGTQGMNVGDQQVLVPLNLLLASQSLLPHQQQNHEHKQQASLNQGYQQQTPATTYSASDILAVLAAQMQNNLGLANLSQTQQAQHGTKPNADASDAPFHGRYFADNSNNNNINTVQPQYYQQHHQGNNGYNITDNGSFVSPFASVTSPFESNANSTSANTPVSMASPASVTLCGPGGGLGSRTASEDSLFGTTLNNNGVQRVLYTALSTESDVSNYSNLSISQLGNNNTLRSGNGNGSSTISSFRSAFALPSFFHGDSPLSGTTPVTASRSTSLMTHQSDSVLSRESSRRTSMDGGGGSGVFTGSGFGSFLFPHLSSLAEEQHQEHHHGTEAVTVASLLQQWDRLNSNTVTPNTTGALFGSSAVPVTPAATTGAASDTSLASSLGATTTATTDDETDLLYNLLPKSIWSLE